nr:protein nrt1/ ptr family 3.1 [Quercus suber]
MDELRNHFRKKKGGTITMPFIFGTSNLTPLLGAFIADSYAGRFWTITVASVTYQIGMACLTVSASLPQLRPPPSAGKQLCKESDFGQPGIIYFSLLMGGIHTCCLNSANIGWGLGLGIPTIAMLFSISIFVVGLPFFQILDPAVSPYTRLLQVIVAAFKKRKVPMVSDPNMFYENAELDASISTDEILCILTSFRLKQGVSFLHRMAIGFFISIFATLVAGFIKVKNKHIAAANGLIDSPKSTLPISVFWLVPQYSLHGI